MSNIWLFHIFDNFYLITFDEPFKISYLRQSSCYPSCCITFINLSNHKKIVELGIGICIGIGAGVGVGVGICGVGIGEIMRS